MTQAASWARSWLIRCYRWGMLGGVVGLIVAVVIVGEQRGRVPVVVTHLDEADHIALRGGVIALLVTRIRTSDCDSKTRRWLWQPMTPGTPENEPKRWRLLQESAPPPMQVGVTTTYEVDVPVPSDITAGQWYFRSEARDTCAWGSQLLGVIVGTQPRVSVDVPIQVRDPSPENPNRLVIPSVATNIEIQGKKQ